MGIKGFNLLEKKYGPFFKQYDSSIFKNKKVIIDTYCYLYKANYARTDNNPCPCIGYFGKIINFLLSMSATPIFILDGVGTSLKQQTHKKRKKLKNGQQNKLDIAIKTRDEFLSGKSNITYDEFNYAVNTIKKSKKAIDMTPTKEDISSLLNLLDKFNIVYHTINEHDAEGLCAYLQVKGYVDIILSDDSDLFAFGATSFIRRFSPDNTMFDVYESELMLKKIKLKFVLEFQSLTICMGNDMNDNIKGCGPMTALKLIQMSTTYGMNEAAAVFNHYGDIQKYKSVMNEFNLNYSEFIDMNKFNYTLTIVLDNTEI